MNYKDNVKPVILEQIQPHFDILSLINITEKNVDSYIDKVLDDILKKIKDKELKSLLQYQKKLIKKTKQLWTIKKTDNIEQLEEFQLALKDAYDTFRKVKQIPLLNKDINDLLTKELEEYKINLINEINSWINDDTQALLKFPLLKYKKSSSIKTALNNDIKYLLLKNINENFSKKKNAVIPSSVLEVAFDPSNRKKFDNVIDKDNKPYLTYVHYFDEDEMFISQIDIEEMRKNSLQITANKLCNAIDFEVLRTLFSYIDENFIKDGVIQVPLTTLVKEVFNNDSATRYEDLTESLAKLSAIMNIVKTKQKEMYMFKFLYRAEIKKDDATKFKIVEVKVDDYIVKDFIKRNLLYIYDEPQIKSLTYKSRLLAIFLHKERLEKIVYYLKGNNIDLNSQDYSNVDLNAKELNNLDLSYNNFKRVFVLGNNKTKGVKIIKDSLEELKKNGILIKDYSYNGLSDSFEIDFFPMTHYAISKIIDDNKTLPDILLTS